MKRFEEKRNVPNAIKTGTTKNWVEENQSKFPKNYYTKEKVEQSSFVKQVSCSYGESADPSP